MRVGIICAGDREVAPFIPIVDECRIIEKAMLKFYEGKINGVETVALFSGVCKVNAAIATQILIDSFKVDAIINAGTAGGMNPKLSLFDTVISTEVAYHDVSPNILTEFHPWMETAYFQADNKLVELSKVAVERLQEKYKVFWGRMVTGETFIVDEGRQAINDTYSPLTVEIGRAHV